MKILHVIGNLGSGGAEKLLLETLPIYNEKGIKSDLLVFDETDYPFLQLLKEKKCCEIFSFGKGTIYNPLTIFKIIPFLSKYDILHVHLFPAQYWVPLAKIVSFSKIKLVLTEHSSSNPRMNNLYFNKLDMLLYRLYDKIVCITDDIKILLLNYTKLSNEKFEVIYNGVNLELIDNAKPYIKSEILQQLTDEDKLVIQVSRFSKEKDQLTVIKAIQHLPENIKLLLIGDGETRKANEELVINLNLQNRVFFLGIRMDIPNLLKTADIVILSSFYEGLSLSSIEGMASGSPFIATNVPGLSNIVKDAGVLFERGNDRELSNYIKKLLSDDLFYNHVVERCLLRSNNYDINSMVIKHIEMYKKINT